MRLISAGSLVRAQSGPLLFLQLGQCLFRFIGERTVRIRFQGFLVILSGGRLIFHFNTDAAEINQHADRLRVELVRFLEHFA